MSQLQVFSNAQIAKMFPAHATEPFPGKVHKVDASGSDDKPFKIHYDDGDKEWVTLAELSEILVDPQLKEQARALLDPAAPPAPQLVAPSSRKRASRDNSGATAAAAAALGGGKKRKSGGAGGEGGEVNTNSNKPQGRAAAERDQTAAAAAGRSRGIKLVRPGAKAAAAAAAAPAAAAGAARVGVSPQVSNGPVSPTALQVLVDDVSKQAPLNANKMHEGSLIFRLPNKGPGTASLPLMSQGVSCGSEALFTVYGTSRGGSSLTPGGAGLIDYRAETADVLRRLDGLMDSTGTAHKQLLTRVRVYLRNMEEGLPGFTQAWNSWVDQGSAPVLTVLQGSGPFSSAGVVLEARAYTGQ